MEKNECKKEAPPPLLASLDKWSRKPPHNEDKARCGGCDLHTNIIFGASLIKNEDEVGVLENFTVIVQLPRNKPVTWRNLRTGAGKTRIA